MESSYLDPIIRIITILILHCPISVYSGNQISKRLLKGRERNIINSTGTYITRLFVNAHVHNHNP